MIDYKYQTCLLLKTVLQAKAPYDTGNLSVEGIWIDTDGNRVLIGGELAPYAAATNEKWVSDSWHGKSNPNEGWINRALEEAMPILEQSLNGKLTQAQYDEIMQHYNQEIDNRAAHLEAVRIAQREKIEQAEKRSKRK